MAKFFYHLQFYCIAWESGRYVSMNSTFYFQPCATEHGTLTDALAANVTLTWCDKPKDQDDLYKTSKHCYRGQRGCQKRKLKYPDFNITNK